MSDTAETIIIGGGVVGLCIARALALHGARRVTVLERGAEFGREASWAAGGMLAPQAEAHAADEFFHLACAARDFYPQFAAALLRETGIDIELEQTGTLYLAFTEQDEREIAERFTWQRAAGLAVERLTAAEAIALEPALMHTPHLRGALRFPHDWQVDNRKLIAALIEACKRRSIQMQTGTEIVAVETDGSGRVCAVLTASGERLFADNIVLAAGAWSAQINLQTVEDKFRKNETDKIADSSPADVENNLCEVAPVRGQMLCFRPRERHDFPLRHVIYSPRGYVIPRRDGRILTGSTTEGVGFDKSVTGAGVAAILRQAREITPALENLPLVEMWAGLRPRGLASAPKIATSPRAENLFLATGHYRNGILLAPLTGEMTAQLVADKTKPEIMEQTARMSVA